MKNIFKRHLVPKVAKPQEAKVFFSMDTKFNLGNYESVGLSLGITRMIGDTFRGAGNADETLDEAVVQLSAFVKREITDLATALGLKNKVTVG